MTQCKKTARGTLNYHDVIDCIRATKKTKEYSYKDGQMIFFIPQKTHLNIYAQYLILSFKNGLEFSACSIKCLKKSNQLWL